MRTKKNQNLQHFFDKFITANTSQILFKEIFFGNPNHKLFLDFPPNMNFKYNVFKYNYQEFL